MITTVSDKLARFFAGTGLDVSALGSPTGLVIDRFDQWTNPRTLGMTMCNCIVEPETENTD